MEKTCGNCGHSISVPIDDDGTSVDDQMSVCPYDWSVGLTDLMPSYNGHLPEHESCESWVEKK